MPGSSYASKEYRRWLGERINPLIDRFGLRGRSDDDYPATSRMRGRRESNRTPRQPSLQTAPAQQFAAPAQQALF
jgi:hypothetical protein